MSVNIDFTKSEMDTIRNFAAALGLTVAEYIKRVTMEQIEDRIDLMELREAKAEHEKNPVTYTLDEVIASYEENV